MSSFMPHWPKPGFKPEDYKLDRMNILLKGLGSPQNKMPTVIHVAGTNGKGSTIAFLRQILEDAGYRVHAYTSPSLVSFNERIVVAGSKISDKSLYYYLERCRIASEELGTKVSFFEGTTAAAFLVFSEVDADFTIIETGLGGRLDATNCISNTLISVITPISRDHMEVLGDTIRSIATEKAGIIHSSENSSVVLSEQPDDALEVLEARAIEKQVPVFRNGYEWFCGIDKDIGGMFFKSSGETINLPLPSLEGRHQIVNSGTAIAVATLLSNKYGYEKITKESLDSGLLRAYWPARLQNVTNLFSDSLDKNWQIYLDGAHNQYGARVLNHWMEDRGETGVHFIIGITQGRDPLEFISELMPRVKSLHCVCVQSEPRSYVASYLQEAGLKLGIESYVSDSVHGAVEDIVKSNSKNIKESGRLIVICGSLYLATDVLSSDSEFA